MSLARKIRPSRVRRPSPPFALANTPFSAAFEPIAPSNPKRARNYRFELELSARGKNIQSSGRRNMNGSVEELFGEIIQNSHDGGATKLRFAIRMVPRANLEKSLGLTDFFGRLDKTVIQDVKDREFDRELSASFASYCSSDMVRVLVIEDNGTGLEGNYASALIPDELRAKALKGELSIEAPGGPFVSYLLQEGMRSKTEGSGGAHGMGGKIAAEMASRIGLTAIYTRRASDRASVFSGHKYLSARTLNGIAISSNAIFYDPERCCFAEGYDADALAGCFGASRRSSESGLTTIIPLPQPAFNFYSMFDAVVERMAIHILHYGLTVEIEDEALGMKASLSEETLHLRLDEFIEHCAKAQVYTEAEIAGLNALDAQRALISRALSVLDAGEPAYTLHGTDLRSPDFFPAELEALKFDFEGGAAFIVRQSVETQRKGQPPVISAVDTVYLPHDADIPAFNTYDRNGICLKLPSKHPGVSTFTLLGDTELSALLRDSENVNHDDWYFRNNQELARTWVSPGRVISMFKDAPGCLIDKLLGGSEDETDTDFLAGLFPDPDVESSRSRHDTGKLRSLLYELNRAGDNANGAKAASAGSRLLQIRKIAESTSFIVGPSSLALSGSELPDFEIRLCFKELSNPLSPSYSSTLISGLWELHGTEADSVIVDEINQGTALRVYPNGALDFSIRINVKDTVRTPALYLHSKVSDAPAL